MTLQRIVLEFKAGELVARVLYRSSLDVPNPGTVRRGREVQDLAREGLRQAVAALEGDSEVVGTSGFTQREDLLSVALPHSYEARNAKRASRGPLFFGCYCKLMCAN